MEHPSTPTPVHLATYADLRAFAGTRGDGGRLPDSRLWVFRARRGSDAEGYIVAATCDDPRYEQNGTIGDCQWEDTTL